MFNFYRNNEIFKDMENLKIEATKYSPMVELTSEGEMTIRGRSIIEDPQLFYNPIIERIKRCKSKTFTLTIQLEYMNTSSSKVMLNLLNTIKDYYNRNNVIVKWFYDSDDEDMLEIGRDYESIICIPIDFYELCEEEEY